MTVAGVFGGLLTVRVAALRLLLGRRGGGAPGSDCVPGGGLDGGTLGGGRGGRGAERRRGCLHGVQAGTPAPFRLQTISRTVVGSACGGAGGPRKSCTAAGGPRKRTGPTPARKRLRPCCSQAAAAASPSSLQQDAGDEEAAAAAAEDRRKRRAAAAQSSAARAA